MRRRGSILRLFSECRCSSTRLHRQGVGTPLCAQRLHSLHYLTLPEARQAPPYYHQSLPPTTYHHLPQTNYYQPPPPTNFASTHSICCHHHMSHSSTPPRHFTGLALQKMSDESSFTSYLRSLELYSPTAALPCAACALCPPSTKFHAPAHAPSHPGSSPLPRSHRSLVAGTPSELGHNCRAAAHP